MVEDSQVKTNFYHSMGAIVWDGSFDAKRSGAITKTRPNDAPLQPPSPKCHQKNRPFFTSRKRRLPAPLS